METILLFPSPSVGECLPCIRILSLSLSLSLSLCLCLSLRVCVCVCVSTCVPKALKILQNTSLLPILEGEALRLLCVADSNPPAQLSWFRGSSAMNATPISSTAILELPRVGTGEETEFICQAQHPLGSQNISLSLSVVCECGEAWQQGTWVLGGRRHL